MRAVEIEAKGHEFQWIGSDGWIFRDIVVRNS